MWWYREGYTREMTLPSTLPQKTRTSFENGTYRCIHHQSYTISGVLLQSLSTGINVPLPSPGLCLRGQTSMDVRKSCGPWAMKETSSTANPRSLSALLRRSSPSRRRGHEKSQLLCCIYKRYGTWKLNIHKCIY